jgi:filamentous hemagglutinin family protein
MRLFWPLAVVCVVTTWTDSALAQRRPIADDTLGNERSIVTPEENLRGRAGERIGGGARRGDNLFHSFREFGIDEGRAVYFDDPGVQNILSRVTGRNVSEIFGRLGVLGDANLFLLNPNGIIFGPNASLDVRGAFVGTTADSFVFENGFTFSATNPQAPPLLTISAPIGLQYGAQTPGAITLNQALLVIDSGQSLILAGGAIILNNAGLGVRNPQGGRIELGAVSAGAVGLAQNGSILSLSIPEVLARADVQITNRSGINAIAENSGSVAINAQNLYILRESLIRAGIGRGRGTASSQAGDIVLDATGEIQVRQSSQISNNVFPNSIGNAGNLQINAGSLLVTDGAALSASTFGQGNAGSVIINADDRVVFDNSDVFSNVESIGNGGDVRITTGSLSLANRAQLQASTFGQGDAGNVILNARDTVFLNNAAILSVVGDVDSNIVAVGNGGNIYITTGSLSLTGGAQLNTGTLGQGNAGNVTINARNRVSFEGVNSNRVPSSVISSAGTTNSDAIVVGDGGDIRITTGSLSLVDGAQLRTSIFGQDRRGNAGSVIIDAHNRVVIDDSNVFSTVGDVNFYETGVARGRGGNINIDTNSLVVRRGALLATSTLGQGNAGNVVIDAANQVVFDNGYAFSTVEETGRGRGGNIEIDTNSLEVRNNTQLQASTFGRDRRSRAGSVVIDADDRVIFDNSAAFSAVGSSAFMGVVRGRGGNVEIDTSLLEVRDGAQLVASTFGRGDAGDVIINAADQVVFDGANSVAFSRVEVGSIGRGGNVEIDTGGTLEVRNGAGLTASSGGQGRAGNIDISAQSVQLDRGGLTAETGRGNGGNIRLRNLDQLQLRNDSLISATAGTAQTRGDGGNIAIDADFILAFPGEDSDIEANASVGDGGRVDITSDGLFGIQARETATEFNDITASSEQGVQGTVNIDVPDTDPSQGLTELPDAPIDASNQIAQTCPSDGNPEALGEFVVTGRGGLPPDPTEIVGGEVVLSQLSTLENHSSSDRETNRQTAPSTAPSPAPSDERSSAKAPLVEAQGWVVDADGNVNLVAETPAVEPHSPNLIPVHCLDS